MAVRLSALSKMGSADRERELSKLVESARADGSGGMNALDAEIRDYEIRYAMTSEKMLSEFKVGVVKDTADIAKWLILVQVRERVRGRQRR